MDRQKLREILIRIEHICSKLNRQQFTRSTLEGRREIEDLVNTVTYKQLRFERPGAKDMRDWGAPTYHAEVHFSDTVQVSLFGLPNIGSKLPLHDHPLIHGFIKVIYGSFEVYSFSTKNHVAPHVGQEIDALYEGVRVLTPADNAVYLSPGNGNLHEIRALEPASVFFDVLVPGYQDVGCSYYEMPANLPPPQSIIAFKRIEYPVGHWSASLDYPRVFEL